MRALVFFLSVPLLFSLVVSHSARAAGIAVVGVANSSEPNEPGTEYKGKPGYGAGVLFELGLMPTIGIEFGALTMARKFEFTTVVPVSSTVTLNAKMYEFPVLLRMHLGSFFSLGVGAYYARGSGEISGETKLSNGATSKQIYTYASRNQTVSDYGALASIALYFHLAPLTQLLLDGRYTIGMKNNNTVAGSERKFNDSQFLAGLRFGF